MKIINMLSAGLLSVFFSVKSIAGGLPFADEMVDDAEDQTVWEFLEDLVSNGFSLAFLLIGGIAFVVVAYNIIMLVIEWRKGKLELGELFNQSFVQIGVLVVVFLLLGFANGAVS